MNYKFKRLCFSLGLALVDIVLIALGLFSSILLRFDLFIPNNYYKLYFNSLPIVVVIFLLVYAIFGLYRYIWKYASVEMVFKIAFATFISVVVSYFLNDFLNSSHAYVFLGSRGIFLIFALISILFLGGFRIFLKTISLFSTSKLLNKTGLVRIMVVGAGWAGASVVRDLKAGRLGSALPIIIVDDKEERIGQKIQGVKVLGGTQNIKKYAETYHIDEIIIAIATPTNAIEQLVEMCLDTGCKVKRVANIEEVNAQNAQPSLVKEIDLLDLLGRPEEKLNKKPVNAYFNQKTVLITGGGGSIGSELCRQIIACNVHKIILFDMSENYIYDLKNELILKFGSNIKNKIILCVGSVQDEHRLKEVFETHQPQIVIHAAAHKHVPLMEDCPTQAVLNNVYGSYNVAKLSKNYSVEKFILISTDKAVNPTNVMGATKRLSELIVEGMNDNNKTKFVIVRFGNVLGSHGSVVPLFEQQIKSGGPVTVTDPNVIRYFMSIQEAAALVLQAATMARGREIFVLDMGKPVKIMDLAKRMIRLYGSSSTQPIEIKIVGMRPGEKIVEELLNDDENVTRTDIDKIKITKSDTVSEADIQHILHTLETCIQHNGDMRVTLRTLVPTYKNPNEVNSFMLEKNIENREYTN